MHPELSEHLDAHLGGRDRPPASLPAAPASGLRRLQRTQLPTRHGVFELVAYEIPGEEGVPLALTIGDLRGHQSVLVRVHDQCLTGDAFGSLRCDCGPQLEAALRRISIEGRGVVIYLPQEGRGIGLKNKVLTYALQDRGLDTIEANQALDLPVDARTYGAASGILSDLGIQSIRLMTNSPEKLSCLSDLGVRITERVSLIVQVNPYNSVYLATKATRMGHLLAEADHQ